LSPRFGKDLAAVVSLSIGLGLAGCGSTGPRPTTSTGTAEVAPIAAVDDRPAITERDAAALVPPLEIAEDTLASYTRALAAMDRGDWLEAERELEALLLEQPALAGPYANLGIIYRRDGREAEAEAALTRALELAPNHPAANNELAILERERGNFAAAESAYRRALEGDPSYALAHYNYGVLLDLYLQRPDEALDHYESYRSSSVETDGEVDLWILDLRRRLGLPQSSAQVAREAGQ